MRWSFAGSRCVVTGASSGLGRCIATELVRRGARVLGTARNEQRLQSWRDDALALAAPPAGVAAVAADLTVAADRMRLVHEAAAYHQGSLDLVVHCAGVGAYGQFLSHDPHVLRDLFEINFFAVAELSRALYPLLKAGRNPRLAALGSIVARRALPGRSEYSASKFALAGLLESLRAEWHRDGIRVVLVNPGFTRTAFEDHLLADTAIFKTAAKRSMTPEEATNRALRAIQHGRRERALSLEGRTLLLVNRLFPRLVDAGFERWTTRLFQRSGRRESA